MAQPRRLTGKKGVEVNQAWADGEGFGNVIEAGTTEPENTNLHLSVSPRS